MSEVGLFSNENDKKVKPKVASFRIIQPVWKIEYLVIRTLNELRFEPLNST